MDRKNTHPYVLRARQVLAIEAEELKRLSESLEEGAFIEAIEAMQNTLENGGKILVTGVGKSEAIGAKIAATMTSTGATAVVLSVQNALHGDLGLIADGDVVLALSFSGETAELVALLPALRRFSVTIIGMTGKKGSSLAELADVAMISPVEREACPLSLAPTSSSTVMLALGDALAMTLLEARGFRQEDFAKLHPGGQLGRSLLTRVKDVMRSDKQMAKVPASATINETLQAMTNARSGCAVVTDDDGPLLGIFTHGDFVRAYQSDPSIGGQRVSDLMTRGPVTISCNALAAELVQLIKKHAIDDVVVLGEGGQPVGIVDVQDLSREKLL